MVADAERLPPGGSVGARRGGCAREHGRDDVQFALLGFGDCLEDLKDVLDPARYAEGTVLDLAGPLAGGEVLRDEVIPARAPWSGVVRKGDILTLVDVGANQSSSPISSPSGRNQAMSRTPLGDAGRPEKKARWRRTG